MKYSLIFTVYNEEQGIGNFSESLLNQSKFPDEIVIVDGGSTDNTVSVLEKTLGSVFGESLKIIVDESCSKKHSKGPIAKGRNVAIRNCSYNNVVVTDAGCILDDNWFERMVDGFVQGADVISGNYRALTKNNFQNYIADIFCKGIGDLDEKDAKQFEPSSRSFGFKKEIWELAGGYPENSYTAEDTKFVRNLFAITNNIYLAKDAIVYWDVPNDFQELKTKLIAYGVGDGIQGLDPLKYFARLLFLLAFPINILILFFLKKKIITLPMYFFQVYGYLKGLNCND